MNESTFAPPDNSPHPEDMENAYKTYRHELAKKGQAALKERAAKGLYRGAIPLGFRRIVGEDRIPRLEADQETKDIILWAQQLQRGGASIQEIADALNAKGFRSTRGEALSKATVWRMLKRHAEVGNR